MSRGTAYLKAWEQRMIDERESVEVIARCAFCPDFHAAGTVKETRELYRTHRLEEHPEIQPKPRKKRLRPFGAIPTNKTLDDNIQAARQQGAATWDGAA